MKKIISIFLIFSVLLSFLTSCSSENKNDTTEVLLYFSNTSKDSLVTEKVNVSSNERENTLVFVKKVVNLLLSGPTVEGHTSVIPEGVRLRGVSYNKENGTVNIDISKEYYTARSKDAPPSEELLARYSLISTITQFEEIKKLKIYVDGKDMPSSSGDGEVFAAMGSGSIMINSPSSVETKTEKFVTLYFTDKNGVNLYPETRKATMTDNSLEKTIVNELIRGPVSGGYIRTFPDSTQLISIETTEKVCFVNFSAAFLVRGENDLAGEKTAVYSVVNSLTRLPEIEKVQILIDGKKPEKDEYQLYSSPLERDEAMIVNVK